MIDHSLTHLLQQRLRFSKTFMEAHAAVLIAITDESDPKVLLTRRSTLLNNHAGEVSSLVANAIRKIPVILWWHCVKRRKKPH